MKKNFVKILFSFYCVVVIGSLLLQNVDYLHPQRAPVAGLYPVMTIPFTFEKSNEHRANTKVLSMYRQSPVHQGVDERFELDTQLTQTSLLENLNVGIHKASKASPAVDDSGIYIGSDTGWIYALNFDGQVRWRYFAADATKGIHSTAATDSKTLYGGTYRGDLIALDKFDGHVVWEIRLGGTIGSSPTIVDDAILISVETTEVSNGYVVKINRSSGEIIWRTAYLGEQSHSSPTVDTEGQSVFIGANNGRIFSFDLLTGKTKWERKVDGAVKSTALFLNKKIYMTTYGETLFCLNADSGQVVWQTDLLGESSSSPSLIPDLGSLIISSAGGHISSIDAITGQLLWDIKNTFSESRQPSALVIPIRQVSKKQNLKSKYLAWIGCKDRTLCAIEPKTGKILAEYKLSGSVTGVPVAFGDSIFVALSESGLVRLSEKTKN